MMGLSLFFPKEGTYYTEIQYIGGEGVSERNITIVYIKNFSVISTILAELYSMGCVMELIRALQIKFKYCYLWGKSVRVIKAHNFLWTLTLQNSAYTCDRDSEVYG